VSQRSPQALTVPGFVDPHLHLLAMAAAIVSVDLAGSRSVGEIVERMRNAAAQRPAGSWLRGFGYDAYALGSSDSPTREELDRASTRHPIVIHERSGHEVVCNDLALRLLGPVAERVDWPASTATGRLYDSDPRLERVPRLDSSTMQRAVAEVSRRLAAEGVTSVTDASARNGPDEILLLAQLRSEGAIVQRVEAMLGAGSLTAATELGWRHGEEIGAVRLGHVKIIAESYSHDELAEAVVIAHAHAWPVAVHVLDIESLDATLSALRASPPPRGSIDRIEHLALSLPEQLDELAALGAAVVTQPCFLVQRSAKYRRELTEVEREWLYRVRSLLDRGILVAASSDAPVTRSAPLQAMWAACTRGVHDRPAGHRDPEAVAPIDALELVTGSAARVGAERLLPGVEEDFVVLDADPLRLGRHPPKVLSTFIEGRSVFEAAN
jgi:predicted amidohydrolase YtcJ